eukprot:CAMPEP_0170552636 /NCGR_PEP_ID=MMETSP0211-20121228/10510_1 /TAXON_ID=311385 /ORGANISM="Pseudokeronopsis sp., Strain OXSARD2" /LENGTH=77 /DNA_ID=CAMNT_0010860485 /DNA_START=1886 /DNA_END=2119 /DNA_ORIENTATION=-
MCDLNKPQPTSGSKNEEGLGQSEGKKNVQVGSQGMQGGQKSNRKDEASQDKDGRIDDFFKVIKKATAVKMANMKNNK